MTFHRLCHRTDFILVKQRFPYSTHLVRARSKEEKVERNGGDHVDEEPALEVVDGDLGRMTDDLVLLVDVCRPEVDEDVHDEHDVDDQVDYRDRVSVPTASRQNQPLTTRQRALIFPPP